MIYLNVSFEKQATVNDLGIFYRIVRVTGIADISEKDEYNMPYDDCANNIGHYEFRTTKEKATWAMGMFETLLSNISCSINNEPSRAFAKWRERKSANTSEENILYNEGGDLNDDHAKN